MRGRICVQRGVRAIPPTACSVGPQGAYRDVRCWTHKTLANRGLCRIHMLLQVTRSPSHRRSFLATDLSASPCYDFLEPGDMSNSDHEHMYKSVDHPFLNEDMSNIDHEHMYKSADHPFLTEHMSNLAKMVIATHAAPPQLLLGNYRRLGGTYSQADGRATCPTWGLLYWLPSWPSWTYVHSIMNGPQICTHVHGRSWTYVQTCTYVHGRCWSLAAAPPAVRSSLTVMDRSPSQTYY
jgi:hypothetical protein